MKVKYYEIRFNSFPDIVRFEDSVFVTIVENEDVAKAFCKVNESHQYKEIEVEVED
jgi:hypothetical protein